MTRIEDSVDVNAPIAMVFSAVTDPRRSIEWNPAIIEVTDITGIPPGVGTSWRQVASYMGRTATLHCRIVEYNPPHEGILEISGDYSGRVVTLCESVEARTRLVQAIEFTPPTGIAGKITMAVVQPAIRREVSQTLARQREVLEREAGGGDGSESA